MTPRKTHDADLCERIRELEKRIEELERRPTPYWVQPYWPYPYTGTPWWGVNQPYHITTTTSDVTTSDTVTDSWTAQGTFTGSVS